MNSFNGKTITVSVEFRRKLIKKVKNNPIVWQNSKIQNIDSVQRREAWKKIEREMGYPCLLKEIQATWASLSEMYFRIIFLRTIERNFEPPVWQFFHEMTFLYDHVKETIENQLGGISPPLFKRKPNPNGSQIPKCPCCVYVVSNQNSEPGMNFVEVKQEDEFANIIMTSTSEISLENYQKANENPISFVDFETEHSMCSLDAEDSKNPSHFLTNSPEPAHIETKKVQSPSQVLMKDKTFDVSERYSNGKQKSSWDKLEILCPNMQKDIEEIHPSIENQNIQIASVVSLNSVNLKQLETLAVMNANMLPILQNSNGSNDQIISLERSASSSNGVLVVNDNCNGKETTSLVASVSKLRAIKRSQIIEAVKANPATYLYNSRKRRKQFIEAWSRVAEELGNVPYQAIKNRWKLIKYRYLKELLLERYSNGMNKSSWEYFDKLEFLRPYMQEDIEIHRIRDRMKNTIEKRAAEFIPGDNTNLESAEPITVDKTIYNISYDKTPKKVVAYVNGNPNIQITSVETANSLNPKKIDHKKPKQLEKPVVLDANTLPILQNRPVKITAVKVFPSINENDKNKPNDNAETPPPAKKLRKITGSERNITDVLVNKTPKRLPSTQVPSLTLNLATVKSAKTAKMNSLEQTKSQKVFLSLDLTLDDDLPATVPTSALKKIETTRLQLDSLEECIYTCKVFPPLDLTTDENSDDDKNASKSGTEIATINENENKKDEDNVICLDDD